ncbi:MAG TPA: sugar ABC transporter permease [Chloroflexota bacterium]
MSLSASPAVERRGWRLSTGMRNRLLGLAFISPWIVGMLAFTAYPILASFYYSFTRYDVINDPQFIGLDNYVFMLTEDPTFQIVLYNTIYIVVVGIPLAVGVAFLLASLLNTDIVGRPIFRTIFFLPSIAPAIAVAMVWLWIYNPNYGLINATLASWGFQVVPWLSSPSLAKLSLIVISVWGQGATIVIFLAALQDVPRELHDAAKVDGADAVQRFRHVTIPLCTPSILFVVVTHLIGWFQYFTIAWVMTKGGPLQSTEFYSMYLYRSAFAYLKMGYASALAWMLFLIVVACTIVIFRSSDRWVHYRGV